MHTKKTQQTREKMLNAFIELLDQKDISQISVIDIVTKSEVHRATFYRHFEDKYDLIQQAEDTIFEEIDALFNKYVRNTTESSIGTEDFKAYREDLLNLFVKHSAFITAMLSSNGDLTFENALYQKIYHLAELGFQTIYQLPVDETYKSEVIGHYAASAAFGVVLQWLKQPKMTTKELSELLDELTIRGVANVIGDVTSEK